MIFNLYKQFPKPPLKSLQGYVNGDEKSISFFLKNNSLHSCLDSPHIKFISADGIMLYGFESNGYDKHGVKKSKYQEWLLTDFDKK